MEGNEKYEKGEGLKEGEREEDLITIITIHGIINYSPEMCSLLLMIQIQ